MDPVSGCPLANSRSDAIFDAIGESCSFSSLLTCRPPETKHGPSESRTQNWLQAGRCTRPVGWPHDEAMHFQHNMFSFHFKER